MLLFVKEWVPKDIGEMSQLADRFKEDRRPNIVSLTNPNLREYPKNDRKGEDKGFKAKGDNYDNRKCYKCGVQGHIGINCPSQGTPGSMNRGTRYGQGQYGKGNNSCAAITSTRDSVIDSAVGHMEPIASIVMPVKRGHLEGKDVSVLRDTGCGGVVVREGLVDKESFVDEQHEYMMADGSAIKTALANVYIDSPYFVGEVIAWCMQNPLYDVIIGNMEGARDPNDPEVNHEVGVVTGLQAKKMAQPYSKLKVPDSISHVSVDDIKAAQQSDERLAKIGEQVKSEAVLIKRNIEQASRKQAKMYNRRSRFRKINNHGHSTTEYIYYHTSKGTYNVYYCSTSTGVTQPIWTSRYILGIISYFSQSFSS